MTGKLDTVTKVNAVQVRLTKYSGPAVSTRCSCITLTVNYSTAGSQEIGDYFEVNLGETRNRVCGIIVQSRNSSDQYPRNYKIQEYVSGSGSENFNDYTEVDIPANRINVASATHIDHLQRRDEDTYTYDDKGVGQMANLIHTFRFRIVTDPIPTDDGFSDLGPVYTPWAVTNEVDDLWAISGSTQEYICIYVHRRTSVPTGPCMALEARNGGATDTDYGANTVAPNTWYWVRVTKAGRTVTAWFYTSEADFNADQNRVYDLSVTIPTSDLAFRYLFAGITWNTTHALACDGDIENFNLGDWQDKVTVTSNVAQDLIHSWVPQSIERLRIVITAQDASHSWEISQIFIYEADEFRYCICEEET